MHTFITVSNGVEIDIILVVADEQEAEPWVKGKHRYNEQYADNVSLLIRDRVGPKVCVDLEQKHKT